MSIQAINVRNQFKGKVSEIIRGEVVSEVDVQTPFGIVTSVITTRSVDELEAFVKKTALEAKTLRETLREDGHGVFAPEESKGVLFSKLTPAYAALSEKHTVFQADPTRAKQIFW